MIKLVATDIDGTILPYNGKFTDGVMNCISRLQKFGVKVVIVTGRMYKGAVKISEFLNLDTPVVAYNGGYIRYRDDVLYEKYLTPERTKFIIQWARDNDVHLNLYSDETLYTECECDEIKRYAEYQKLDYKIADFTKLSYDKIHKLLAIDYNNYERVTNWANTMSELLPDLYVIKSTPYFCEFSPKEATKACAVDFLKDYWGLEKNEILTIGDQDNDIELIKSGGISVAMGNGTDELKKYAEYITGSVEDDGFVSAMEKFVFPDYERKL